jgi:hypothetical protein
LLRRQERHGTGQPLGGGRRIAYGSPHDALEARRQLLGDAGGQQRLADTGQPQDLDHPHPLVDDPALQAGAFGQTIDEAARIGGFSPVPVAVRGGPLDGGRSVGQQLGEPRLLERRAQPRALAGRGLPERTRLGPLTANRKAAAAQVGRHQALEAIERRVAEAGLPVLDSAHVHPEACGQLALGQTGPPTAQQGQTAEAFGW